MTGKKTIPIPTFRRGENWIEVLHYGEGDRVWRNGRWTPVERLPEAPVYEGWLHVTGYRKGRSSSCYEVQIATFDEEDGDMTVGGLMTCFQFLPLIAKVEQGTFGRGVYGKWTVRKRGQNYLIEAAE